MEKFHPIKTLKKNNNSKFLNDRVFKLYLNKLFIIYLFLNLYNIIDI